MRFIRNHRFIIIIAAAFLALVGATAAFALPYLNEMSTVNLPVSTGITYETEQVGSTPLSQKPSTKKQTKKSSSTKTGKPTTSQKKSPPGTPDTGLASSGNTSTGGNSSSSSPEPAATANSEIASESTCPGQSGTANVASVLTCMTSHARKYHDLSEVTNNASLNTAAVSKSQDLIDCSFTHTACGRAFNYWVEQGSYVSGCVAENIAAGQSSIRTVFKAWMDSPGHRSNILRSNYEHVGFGLKVKSGTTYTYYWTMFLDGC